MVSAEEIVAHLEMCLDTGVGEGDDLLSTGEKAAFLCKSHFAGFANSDIGPGNCIRGYYYELYTKQYEEDATAKILA